MAKPLSELNFTLLAAAEEEAAAAAAAAHTFQTKGKKESKGGQSKQSDTLWNHEDDLLLCKLYGYFFNSSSVVRGRWVDVSDALGTERTQNACRHRYNAIKERPEMAAEIADGARCTRVPQRSGGGGRAAAAAASSAGATAVASGFSSASGGGGGGVVGPDLLGAVRLARQGELAAAERSEKKKRRGMSEIEKKEEAGRRCGQTHHRVFWSQYVY